jgi:hypothetical protein
MKREKLYVLECVIDSIEGDEIGFTASELASKKPDEYFTMRREKMHHLPDELITLGGVFYWILQGQWHIMTHSSWRWSQSEIDECNRKGAEMFGTLNSDDNS